MSADIIQFIPRPKRDDVETDSPAIAFRSTRREGVIDPVDASSDKHTVPADREA